MQNNKQNVGHLPCVEKSIGPTWGKSTNWDRITHNITKVGRPISMCNLLVRAMKRIRGMKRHVSGMVVWGSPTLSRKREPIKKRVVTSVALVCFRIKRATGFRKQVGADHFDGKSTESTDYLAHFESVAQWNRWSYE